MSPFYVRENNRKPTFFFFDVWGRTINDMGTLARNGLAENLSIKNRKGFISDGTVSSDQGTFNILI